MGEGPAHLRLTRLHISAADLPVFCVIWCDSILFIEKKRAKSETIALFACVLFSPFVPVQLNSTAFRFTQLN